ncbi:MAG: hypothetical protein ACI9XC_002481 [Gammaproteobacteria bacterium]|jgi:hypothetical protein
MRSDILKVGTATATIGLQGWQLDIIQPDGLILAFNFDILTSIQLNQ